MTKKTDTRPKSIVDKNQFRLTYLILKSGECVIGTQGVSFGAFTSPGGAAWFLRQFADGIERDGEQRAQGKSVSDAK